MFAVCANQKIRRSVWAKAHRSASLRLEAVQSLLLCRGKAEFFLIQVSILKPAKGQSSIRSSFLERKGGPSAAQMGDSWYHFVRAKERIKVLAITIPPFFHKQPLHPNLTWNFVELVWNLSCRSGCISKKDRYENWVSRFEKIGKHRVVRQIRLSDIRLVIPWVSFRLNRRAANRWFAVGANQKIRRSAKPCGDCRSEAEYLLIKSKNAKAFHLWSMQNVSRSGEKGGPACGWWKVECYMWIRRNDGAMLLFDFYQRGYSQNPSLENFQGKFLRTCP